MVTREEHSRRVKRKRFVNKVLAFVGLSIFIVFLVGSYIDSQNNDIQLVSQWHECKPNICDYRITIHNTTKLRKSAFVRVIAYYRKVHPDGGDTYPVVNSERIELNLIQGEQKELVGSLKVPIKAHKLKFHVGTM